MPVPAAPQISPHDRAKSAGERAGIDASCRGPVLFFAASAVVWLLVGSLMALLASFKFHTPWLLSTEPALTFGRVRPSGSLARVSPTAIALGAACAPYRSESGHRAA